MSKCLRGLLLLTRYGWVWLVGAGFVLSTAARPAPPVPSTATPREVPPQETMTAENSLLYASETGRFSTWIPIPYYMREQVRIFSPDLFEYRQFAGTAFECHDLIAKDDSAAWVITYCDYPADILADSTTDEILDMAAGAAIRFFGRGMGERLEQKAITYDGWETQFSGRAVRYVVDADAFNFNSFNVQDPSGPTFYTETLKAHIYLTDSRLYWVAAIVSDQESGKRLGVIEQFLNSFSIYTE